MKNPEKFAKNLVYFGIGLVVFCGIAGIIDTAFISKTTNNFVSICWMFNTIVWTLMYLGMFRKADNLQESYNRLDKQFDDLCDTAEQVNNNNIKQNKLCEDVNKVNKDLLESQKDILARCHNLVNDLYKTRMALLEVDPKNPLLVELLEKYEELKQKEDEHQEEIES